MLARFRSLSDNERLVVASSKALSVLSRQMEGEDATRLESDKRQNPTMWANARKQKGEDVAAANLAAAKNEHLTENDSSGDAILNMPRCYNQDSASNRDTTAWTHGDCSRFSIMGPACVAACRLQSSRSRA
jgi:hypothetical protein